MTYLKNFLIMILVILLGIGLGVGIFYGQKKYFSSTNTEAISDSGSEISSTKPESKIKYTNSKYTISFNLPKDTLISESEGLDTKTKNNYLKLEFLTTKSATTVSPTGNIMYVVNKSDSFTSQDEANLVKSLLPGTIQASSFNSSSDNNQIVQGSYKAVDASTYSYYQTENDTLFILAYEGVGTSLSQNALTDILTTITGSAKSTLQNIDNSDNVSTLNSPLFNQTP